MNQPPADFQQLSRNASTVFVPATPIVDKDLFAGRLRQVQKVIDAINQAGQHAILYGERGVGKTSLANVLAPLARVGNTQLVSAKINCDGTDTFETVWRKALQELRWMVERHSVGFTGETRYEVQSLGDKLPQNCAPNDLRILLNGIPIPAVLIFDEFDRLQPRAARLFTDLIKVLSDYAIPTTIVLVGVASTVDQLVSDHASIERALVQIQMPRMMADELLQIIKTGETKLGVTFESEASKQIVQISQGLPHYAHLIALHTVRAALGRQSLVVSDVDVESGIAESVADASQSIKTQYHKATSSSHTSALFEQVLIACALAKKDQLSFFRASDVSRPLSVIMGKEYDVPAFARHLSEFCSDTRGNVLQRQGPARRIRYRFSAPLLEPFVVMSGRALGLVSAEVLSTLATPQ